jgi:hypothetical protein
MTVIQKKSQFIYLYLSANRLLREHTLKTYMHTHAYTHIQIQLRYLYLSANGALAGTLPAGRNSGKSVHSDFAEYMYECADF